MSSEVLKAVVLARETGSAIWESTAIRLDSCRRRERKVGEREREA